jgi:hypothetical protein
MTVVSKIIHIERCESCPFHSRYDSSLHDALIACNATQSIDTEKQRVIVPTIGKYYEAYNLPIPEWCPLSDEAEIDKPFLSITSCDRFGIAIVTTLHASKCDALNHVDEFLLRHRNYDYANANIIDVRTGRIVAFDDEDCREVNND